MLRTGEGDKNMSKINFHQDALQKIREEFQRFPLPTPARLSQHWMLIPGETPELLAHALQYLCESMKIDRAAVFLLDEASQTLQAQEIVDHGVVMAGEDEIVVIAGSPLAQLLAGKREQVIVQ